MQFSLFFAAISCLLSFSTAAVISRPTPAPFTFQYLFTIAYNLTEATPTVNVHDDVVRLGAIVNGGTVRGPAANGTITGGAASPIRYDSDVVEAPECIIYGNFTDGTSFILTESGNTNATTDNGVVKLVFSTNSDKYKYLQYSFVVGRAQYVYPPGFVQNDVYVLTATF